MSSSLDKIEQYLRLQHNVAIDRVKFEERQQEEGESFDSFLIASRRGAVSFLHGRARYHANHVGDSRQGHTSKAVGDSAIPVAAIRNRHLSI